MSLKVYSADKKQAEGLVCLPADNRIQVVKVIVEGQTATVEPG